jgi:hypothetical protein
MDLLQEQTLMVANEMKDSGYKAQAFDNGKVEISLSSRKVSQIEIRSALAERFDGIEFSLKSTWNGVLVTV